jgi:ubiquinone biosynthesis protein
LTVMTLGTSTPPRKIEETFRAGFFPSVLRLGVWLGALARFFAGSALDILLGRGTVDRRARRLRMTIESVGATFLKLGQQLSTRADLLPYEYILELERLLDEAPPFPFSEAVEVISRAVGGPLHNVFASVEPEPVGSGSVACVYRGVLKNGRRVAIKVRRPQIGEHFATDMRVMGWLIAVAELYFLPPGFSTNLLFELKTMLFEELDFTKEARYTEIFRRQVRKAGLHFITAPKVFFRYSNQEVLVLEFVSGTWLKDLVTVVELKDHVSLARLADQGITPKKVARRVLKVSRFGMMEGLFFHADLHPANVVVHPKGHLTVIDFGSCGAYTERERRLWHRFSFAHRRKDVGDMVQAVLALLEPLPPIDLDSFTRRVEALFWKDFYANSSRHSKWWERTSANLWIGFFSLAREYRLPINLNTLRMLRSTMLVDTLAARLYPHINHYEEYHRYEKELGKRTRKRLIKKVKELKQPEAYIRYEQIFQAGMASIQRLQRFLDTAAHLITRIELPIHFAIALALSTGLKIILTTFGFVLAVAVWATVTQLGQGSWSSRLFEYLFTLKGLTTVVTSGWYFAFLGITVAVALRRVLERLKAKRRPHD